MAAIKDVRPINIDGKRRVSLHAVGYLGAYSAKSEGLTQTKPAPICNASAPLAPVGYDWPHLRVPARQINGGRGK